MEERRFQNNAKCVAVIETSDRLNVSQLFLIGILIFTRFLVSSGDYGVGLFVQTTELT